MDMEQFYANLPAIAVLGYFLCGILQLNIDVLDHLIIGRQRFVSLKERGLGFK